MLDLIIPSFLLLVLVIYIYRLPYHFRLSTSHTHHPLSQHLYQSSSSPWSVSMTRLSLHVSTSAFNHLPRRIIAVTPPSVVFALKRFYNLGTIAGAVGGVISVLGTVWAWAAVWLDVWAEARAHAEASSSVESIIKRAIPIAPLTLPGKGVQPLIPGITIPLRHLPSLFLATLLCQMIHEAGHALSGSLDGVYPSRISFAFYLAIPQASVSFSHSHVDNLPSRAKSRLAASGPWHNLVCWVLFTMISFSGVCGWFYTDVVNGVVVHQVDTASPLYAHLNPGDIITSLDDWPISNTNWLQYLTSNEQGDWSRGWCVDISKTYIAPCNSLQVEFQPVFAGLTTDHVCLDRSLLLSPTVSSCSSGSTLLQLSPTENIMRLEVEGRTLLWNGPRKQVLNSVMIRTQVPRIFKRFFLWLEVFYNQLQLVSLSLFLFNLLPLPYTDGIQLFCSLLLHRNRRSRGGDGVNSQPSRHPSYAFHEPDPEAGDDYGGFSRGYNEEDEVEEDEELIDGPLGRESVWQRRVRRGVEGSMTAIVGGWAGGWLMLALLRSS